MPSSLRSAPDIETRGSPASDGTPASMYCVDTSQSERVPILMEMIGSISRATSPVEVQKRFARGLRQLLGPINYISLSTRGLRPGEYRVTRMIFNGEGSSPDEQDPWSGIEQLPVYSGGFLGEIIRQAYPELIYNLNVEDDPVLGDRLAPYRSLMALPIFDQGEPLNWGIVLSREPQGFTVAQMEEFLLRSNLIGGVTRNTLIARDLRRANERITQQVEQIAQIQRNLLPVTMPDIPNWGFAASYRTCEQAGGDYYDFIPLERIHDDLTADVRGKWVVAIADASGHGPSAAVVMAMLHAILHAFPGENVRGGPGSFLEFANRNLCDKRLEGAFVTAFLAILDPEENTFTYARAGHNPPLIKNAGSGGAVTRLDAIGGLPLGVMRDQVYESRTIRIERGQTIVLYTDGITDAMNGSRTLFGIEGIEAALTECTGEPECVIGSINDALIKHTGDQNPVDDQTLVAMKCCHDGC